MSAPAITEAEFLATWQAFADYHRDQRDHDGRVTEPCDEEVLATHRPSTIPGAIAQLRYSLYCYAGAPWLEMAALGGMDEAFVTAKLEGDDGIAECLWSTILALETMEGSR